jgi:putative photosynthetic complex assembly protein
MIVDHNAHDHFRIHTVPIAALCGVVVITVMLAASVSLGFFSRVAVPSEFRAQTGIEATAERQIQFYDEADGTIRIEDTVTGEALAFYGSGEGGFVRTTARSLVHSRRLHGIGQEVPFNLTLWDNGALTLSDPATQKTVELASFGKDNRAVFAALIEKEAQ